ncbi:hypothetical protein Taro_023394 [Colocasia esculenta]|uniref:Secreted protein n=1 Tax=Colocasia esculenta TaxID=4460 RepID=A0A843V4J7_COLES|nr:hypothetical protein [Colocasia esculenta]
MKWCVPLCLHGLWFGIPCEASARSREADSDQIRYRFNGLGRGGSENTTCVSYVHLLTTEEPLAQVQYKLEHDDSNLFEFNNSKKPRR